jgi:hypothetical protein
MIRPIINGTERGARQWANVPRVARAMDARSPTSQNTFESSHVDDDAPREHEGLHVLDARRTPFSYVFRDQDSNP